MHIGVVDAVFSHTRRHRHMRDHSENIANKIAYHLTVITTSFLFCSQGFNDLYTHPLKLKLILNYLLYVFQWNNHVNTTSVC